MQNNIAYILTFIVFDSSDFSKLNKQIYPV